MKSPASLIVILIALLFLCSCSNNGVNSDPIQSPNNNDELISKADTKLLNDRGVFGAWKVQLDIENLTAEIIPSRNAVAIGDVFDADLTQFLTVSPCSNCIRINNIWIEPYRHDVYIDLQIKHPFGNIATRLDLHGFDVRAIFIAGTMPWTFPSVQVMRPDGTLEDAGLNTSLVSNADGYTSHYDELVNDDRYFPGATDIPGNLNPFIRFFENTTDVTFDPNAPAGHNVMPVGADFDTKKVVLSLFQMSNENEFYIVADVAYGQSAVLANRTTPQYYLPAFNRTEPWRVEYWIENNILDGSNVASTADLVVQVFDWQHGATVDASYPDPANLSGIPVSSDVSQLELSIPQLLNDPIVVDLSEAESGSGSPTDPLQFRITLTNENAQEYTAYGLLAVRDDLYGSTGRMAVPEAPSGFPYDTLDILDYTFYTIVTIPIANKDGIRQEFSDELYVEQNDRFITSSQRSLTANHYLDRSGTQLQYYWDYDYNGGPFDVDGEGMPSPDISFPDGGIQNIGLGVVTNSVPPVQNIYTIPMYVEGKGFEENLSPSADIRHATSINRSSSMVVTENYYYLAYTSEQDGKRDIWLNICDKYGRNANYNLTGDLTGHCFEPSLEVVTEGPDAGIYVLFLKNTGGVHDLYTIKGTLSMSGFGVAEEAVVATGGGLVFRYNNQILYKDGTLLAYWYQFSGIDGKIKVAHSDDMADTWVVDGDINTIPSPAPYYSPDIEVLPNTGAVYCVWSDYRDISVTGADLYLAGAWDGINFSDGENISTIQGNVDELFPSMTADTNQFAIAYQTDDGVNPTEVRVKIVNTNNFNSIDINLNTSVYNGIESAPTITGATANNFLVAYGSHDPVDDSLYMIIREIKTEYPIGYIGQAEIYRKNIGTVTNDYDDVWAALGSVRRFNGEAVEYFCAYRSFETGKFLSSVPYDWRFGQIESLQYIGDGRN